MVPPRPRLPPPFEGTHLLVADARREGIEGQLRRRALHTPHRGIRTRQPASSLRERASSLCRLLPSAAISHTTAAVLLGLPLPARLGIGDDSLLHVMVGPDGTPPRRTGVVGHRGLERRRVITLPALTVTDLPDTWGDLAGVLTVEELVVVGDAIAQRRHGTADLHEVVRRRRGGRGATALRLALTRVRVGSESPGETRARLALVGSGIPEPELNATIVDRWGGFLAVGDLVWREHKVVVEYLGAAHFEDLPRTRADIDRRRVLEGEGWLVIEITARDLVTPARVDQLACRVAAALHRAAR